MAQERDYKVVYRVIDALDAPHGGRILRLRQKAGEAPKARELKGAHMVARAPDGEERTVEVEGFVVFGGKPDDDRIARTGRVDLRVFDDAKGSSRPISFDWELAGPVVG